MKVQLNDILNKITHSDVLVYLRSLPDQCVDCIVTSPPYYGLRDYGMHGQIGLEETPEAFVGTLTEIFIECLRILRTDGTLWLNIGDSYASNTKGSGGIKKSGLNAKKDSNGVLSNDRKSQPTSQVKKINHGVKQKDLIGIPWMLAFSLRASGYYLRQDIIWAKPNPMPESVTDRCTKSHEYIFLLSKSAKYYYDYAAIMQDAKNPEDDLRRMLQQTSANKSNPDLLRNGLRPKSWNGSGFDVGKTSVATNNGRKSGNKERKPGIERGCPENSGSNVCASVPLEGMKANKRSVWTVTTKPFKEAHFATFPTELIVDCIKAGSPEGGVILDPFMGAGTTALVARKLNRNFIGCELNPEYIKIANKRLATELGMFK